MPTRANRTCPVPGCGGATKGGRCPRCTRGARAASPYREPSRKQGTAVNYGRDHQKRRAAYLANNPWCAWPGCSALATDLDHRDGDPSNNPRDGSNWQGLCRSHHSRKTARHDGGFGNKRTPRPPRGHHAP